MKEVLVNVVTVFRDAGVKIEKAPEIFIVKEWPTGASSKTFARAYDKGDERKRGIKCGIYFKEDLLTQPHQKTKAK